MQKNIPVVCYDLHAVSRFIRSCALVIATQHSMKIEWETYRDSKVINAIYTVFFWKEAPGMAVVKDGSPAEIERRADQMHERYLLTWVRKLAEQGPRAAHEYIAFIGHLRDMARKDMQNLFREVSGINSDVIGETQRGIANLAAIKLGAQIGVATIGAVVGIGFVAAAAAGGAAAGGLTILGLQAGASGTAFALAGTAHSVTHSLIKDWDAGRDAKVAGIATELTKAGVSEAGGRGAGHALEKALAGSVKAQSAIRSAEGEIRKYSARLAQQGLTKKASEKTARRIADNIGRQTARAAELARHNNVAIGAAATGKMLPVVFAGWEIYDALEDYRKTIEANR
ncbi:hypothetical protein OIU35_05210 [Boseaceae bacterium BT-24-1]|nr:hypothetical protein [Boseaceae bacterium BT-24-1]